MFPRVLSICVSLCAVLISTKLHATEQKDAEQKLYCIVLANQKNRTDDFHYYMRSCPAGGGACFSKREPHVLRNKGGPSTQGTVWCSVQRSPIEFELTFDESDQPGYQERLDVLKPQTFAWRGLVPNIWCVGNAWFHFTSKRSGAGVAPGYPHKTQRGRCEWEEATYGSVSSAETALPQSVVGSWVPKGTECPGFFDNGSRGGKVLWVQPHAIERSEGACRLTGRFNLGSSFTARALCAAGNRYGNTEFTFDRIDDETMRLREGRGRRVTYKRCQRNWLVDPEQWNAVEKLKGQTLSFVLDIEVEMRGVESKKTVDGSHTRKIELQVNDDGTLTDRMQIGDSAEPKIFKARLGEITVDSDGDRATWLVEDGRLKRVRERKGYYEILSWPLNFDSRSVKCQAEMELAPTRADGKLRTLDIAGAEHDVIKAEIKSQRCPAEPLSFKVAAKAEEAKPPGQCVKSDVYPKEGAPLGVYQLLLMNSCNYDIVVRAQSQWLSQNLIVALGPSLTNGPVTIGRDFSHTYTVTFGQKIDTKAYLKLLEVDALRKQDFSAACGDDLKDREASLQCFGKVYVAKHGEPDWVKDAKTAGGCVAADPDIAIKACTADIAAGKTDADTLNNRAVAYMQKGQFDLALPDLDQAIERDPKHFGALSNRGIVLMKKNEHRRAIEDLSKAIDLAPMPLRPYRQRAEAYAALGEHTKAWKDAGEALKIDPKDDKAHALKRASAQAAFGLKPGDWAELYAESCSQNEDPDLRVYACLALIKEGMLGAEDLALAHIYIGQVAEALSKREFFAKRKKSAQKNIKSALNHYALAIKIDMKNPIGYAEIGKVLIAAKKYDQAEQWLLKGQHAAPASRMICDRLVLLYERKGDSAARDKQNGRCEVLPKDNPFRKIRAGNAEGDAASDKAKSAYAKNPGPFDMGEKPSPKDGTAKKEQRSYAAAAADNCIKRSMHMAGKNSGTLSINNDCNFDVVGLGWGRGEKARLKLIVDLPAQQPFAGDLAVFRSFTIDLAPNETPEAFLAAMTFQAVKKSAFTDLCGKPSSGWADNELRCFREAHDGKSYQATHGPTQDMKTAEKMCTGKDVDRDQPSIAQKSIAACTRLLEFGIIGADGTMDREDTAFLYYYRGTTYGILKQNDKMLADLHKAILLDRNKPQFYYFRAVAFAKLNRDSEAIRDSNKACEMDKQFCK